MLALETPPASYVASSAGSVLENVRIGSPLTVGNAAETLDPPVVRLGLSAVKHVRRESVPQLLGVASWPVQLLSPCP